MYIEKVNQASKRCPRLLLRDTRAMTIRVTEPYWDQRKVQNSTDFCARSSIDAMCLPSVFTWQLANAKKNPTKLWSQYWRLIQEGCKILASQEKPRYIQVCQQLKTRYGCVIPYFTLHNRYLGNLCHLKRPMSNSSFYLLRQRRFLLTGSFISLTLPTLSAKAPYERRLRFSVGRKPSQSWIRWFLRQWPDIQLGKPLVWIPSALKHSTTQLLKHFDLLLEIIQKHGIPVRIYITMDEKGCQWGGGRKGSGRK